MVPPPCDPRRMLSRIPPGRSFARSFRRSFPEGGITKTLIASYGSAKFTSQASNWRRLVICLTEPGAPSARAWQVPLRQDGGSEQERAGQGVGDKDGPQRGPGAERGGEASGEQRTERDGAEN